MNRTLLALGMAACISAQAAAPGKAPATPKRPAQMASPTPAQDPVSEFKALVASASTSTEASNVHQDSKSQRWTKQLYTPGEVKYDVKKTDSLISPIKGIVTFPVTIRTAGPFDTKEQADSSTAFSGRKMTAFITGEYNLVDGAWQLNNFSYQVAFGENPPDRDTITVPRDKLIASEGSAKGIAVILKPWIR
jgi:hypothetical protein